MIYVLLFILPEYLCKAGIDLLSENSPVKVQIIWTPDMNPCKVIRLIGRYTFLRQFPWP